LSAAGAVLSLPPFPWLDDDEDEDEDDDDDVDEDESGALVCFESSGAFSSLLPPLLPLLFPSASSFAVPVPASFTGASVGLTGFSEYIPSTTVDDVTALWPVLLATSNPPLSINTSSTRMSMGVLYFRRNAVLDESEFPSSPLLPLPSAGGGLVLLASPSFGVKNVSTLSRAVFSGVDMYSGVSNAITVSYSVWSNDSGGALASVSSTNRAWSPHDMISGSSAASIDP
jgi:hypothetical protein